MTYSTDTLLAIAMKADAIVRYAAPRSILASGLAYHIGKVGETDTSREVLAQFRETLKAAGATKGEQSTKAKQAKMVGDHILERFGQELASTYADETDLVEACFAAAYADGVKSVARLLDYMQHGDANYTDTKKQAAKEEKEAEKSAALADKVAAVAGVELGDIPLGVPVAPTPVQNFEPEAETSAKGQEFDAVALVDSLTPEQFKAVHKAMIAKLAADSQVVKEETKVAKAG